MAVVQATYISGSRGSIYTFQGLFINVDDAQFATLRES